MYNAHSISMPRHAQNTQRCWISLIGCMQRKMPKISNTPVYAQLYILLKHPGENQPFFSISIASFSLLIFFYWEIYHFEHIHKKRNLVFILSHYSYACTQLTAISICANDIYDSHFCLSCENLFRVYSKRRQRRKMNFPKTHNDTIRCYEKSFFPLFYLVAWSIYIFNTLYLMSLNTFKMWAPRKRPE